MDSSIFLSYPKPFLKKQEEFRESNSIFAGKRTSTENIRCNRL